LPAEKTQTLRPLVVWLNPGPWPKVRRLYNAEAAAFAQMGFAVLELYPRGSDGLGSAYLHAGRHTYDTVTAEDILAALEALPKTAGIDRNRVGLFGQDYGAFLALRTLQLQPDRFACAVTLQPRVDLTEMTKVRFPESSYHTFEQALRTWFFGDSPAQLRARSPAAKPDLIRTPVFIAANPDSLNPDWSQIRTFQRNVAKSGTATTLLEITAGALFPGAEQARLWRGIEAFLQQHLSAAAPNPPPLPR
jgi:dipeptidyl aminopeptidase/acylaminoacyl peptidase